MSMRATPAPPSQRSPRHRRIYDGYNRDINVNRWRARARNDYPYIYAREYIWISIALAAAPGGNMCKDVRSKGVAFGMLISFVYKSRL